MRPYFVVIFTYIGLKNRPKIYGRYLHFRILNFPLKYEPFKKNPCWLITTMGIIMSPRDYYRVIWMGIFLINNPHFLITTGSYTLFGGFLCHQETWGYSSECCNVQSVCCTLTHINIYIHYRNQVPKTDIVGPVVFCLKGDPAQILLQLASSNPDIFTPGLLHIRVASGLSDSLTFQGS